MGFTYSSDTLDDQRAPLAKWVLLCVLIPIEGALVGARLDALPLADSMPQWWARALAHTGFVFPLAMAVVTATLLCVATRIRQEVPSLASAVVRPYWSWLVLGHLTAFAIFFRLAIFVFDGELIRSSTPGSWAAACVVAGIATLVLWCVAALPPGTLWPLVRLLGPVLPVSILVGLAAWGAGVVTSDWWKLLQQSTLGLVYRILSLLTSDVIVHPSVFVIGTQRFLVEVAPKCSGYEGIGLIGVFLSAYLWLFRTSLRFPRAFLLLPIGMTLAWLSNVLRIVALVAVGSWLSPVIALGGFHAYSGMLLFCALALGLAAGAQHVPFFAVPRSASATTLACNPTAAYLAPLLVTVVAASVTRAFAEDKFDPLYPVQIFAVGAVLWFFQWEYRRMKWSWSWSAIGIGAIAFTAWAALGSFPSDDGIGVDFRIALDRLPGAWAVGWIALRALGSVVTVPLAEELAFRGYLTRRLVAADFQEVSSRCFSWWSFFVSSLLFGAMHDHFLAGTACGMLYALALYRRGELSDAVVAHATTNVLLVVFSLTRLT